MFNKKIINAKNLINNVNYCLSKKRTIIAMLKADAYGHGMKQIALCLAKYISLFGVANEVEALELNKILENKTIIVVGKSNNYKKLINNQIEFTIDSIDEVKLINTFCKKLHKKAYIHIAINSGMNRIGVKNVEEFKELVNFIDTFPDIILKGIFTHLFDADLKKSHFQQQMTKFESFYNTVKSRNLFVHIGGSFCLMHTIPSFINAVRVGYFLYGYGNINVKPVMKIQSKIIKITVAKSGESVGYDNGCILSKKTRIALVPIGYADGVPRNVSNKWCVKINGRSCKVLGYVCMDMLMVNVNGRKANLHDDVIIMDNAELLGKYAKTSPYEILTNFVSMRGKNLIIKEN